MILLRLAVRSSAGMKFHTIGCCMEMELSFVVWKHHTRLAGFSSRVRTTIFPAHVDLPERLPPSTKRSR